MIPCVQVVYLLHQPTRRMHAWMCPWDQSSTHLLHTKPFFSSTSCKTCHPTPCHPAACHLAACPTCHPAACHPTACHLAACHPAACPTCHPAACHPAACRTAAPITPSTCRTMRMHPARKACTLCKQGCFLALLRLSG